MSANDIDVLIDCLSKTGVAESKKCLSFAFKNLKLENEDTAKEITDAIYKCEGLEVLELKGNTLGVEASKAIGKALEIQPKFKEALWSDMFTGRSKAEIPYALKNLCSGMLTAGVKLVVLDLSDNAFGPNGMVGLTDFLKSPCCYTLQELRLNNNGLGITGGKMLADSLLSCYLTSLDHGQPMALKVFVSGRGRLEDEGATALAGVFKMMKSLIELQMPQNGINPPGIKALADALPYNPNLKILNLADNTFVQEGSKSIAKALGMLTSLENINFEDCLLGDNGALSICEVLMKGHDDLKELKLSGNELTTVGAAAVIAAIENKQHLVSLELNCNQFGKDGIKEIKKSMAKSGKSEVLGSLSDDEGDDDDEDDDNDSGDDDNDASHDNDSSRDNDVTVDNDTSRDNNGTHDGDVSHDNNASCDKYVSHDNNASCDKDVSCDEKEHSIEVSSTTTFNAEEQINNLLEIPSKEKLKDINQVNPGAIPAYLEDRIDLLDEASLAIMKMAQLCSKNDSSELTNLIFSYADTFYEKAFDESSFSWVVNSILSAIGLIKGEKKDIKLPKDIGGSLLLLQHIAKQKYFSSEARGVLQYFLECKKQGLEEHKDLTESILKELSSKN